MKWLALWAMAVVLSLAGCDCSDDGPSGRACESRADCAEGFICVDGMCRMTAGDAGPVDTGPPPSGCVDADGDGHFALGSCPEGDDCDDGDAVAYPGATELCGNGGDDDCDGSTDEADCACRRGDWIACYHGPDGTRGVGACRGGVSICVETGVAGDCRGEALPSEEDCDAIDDDCDGRVDEGLRNACGACAPEPSEMCGNDVDDDCDGMADEDCDCDWRCLCDPADTSCTCTPPTAQPCYEGPFGTEGRGACRGGRRDCLPDPAGGEPRWGTCVDQVLPGGECAGGTANGIDDDCDGTVDDGCSDADGDGSPAPADCDDSDAAIHPGATETCNDRDDDCDGAADEGVRNACGGCGAAAASETCDNGRDDDCNGLVDDRCPCPPGGTQDCYGGPEGTLGVGACRGGTQTCMGVEFAEWSACTDSVLPLPEVCNGADDDCDGETDERWAAGSNRCGFCTGEETCDDMDNDCDGAIDEGVANRCGDCGPEPVETCNGVDEDCDAIVDEGVVNSCGMCGSACYEERWDMPASCMVGDRRCDGVTEHPDYPGSITLGEATFENSHIYIAVTNRNQVAQLDTETGVKNWQVDSRGTWPSRTAVALDGSVWVANRGFGNPADFNQSNVVHLGIDGSLICRAPVVGIARGLAIDADGNIWAGTWDYRRMWKISGTIVDPPGGGDPLPQCRVLAFYDVGVNIYGLAADGSGYIWTSSSPSVRMDARTGAWMTVGNPSFYGIAPDRAGNIWLGGWSTGGNVHAIRPDFSIFDTGIGAGQVTAVTVHPDGSVWGSGYGSNQVIAINAGGGERCRAGIPGSVGGTGISNPHGVAVDRRNRIWMPIRYGGYVTVWDTACTLLATYPVDPGYELYSYSDMTGHLLRTVTTREGHWIQDFDSGYERANWDRIEWDSIVPPETGVDVTVWSAPTRAALGTGMPCGPFTTSPASLDGCAWIDGNRYLRVDVRLTTSRSGVRPIVHNVRAFWSY